MNRITNVCAFDVGRLRRWRLAFESDPSNRAEYSSYEDWRSRCLRTNSIAVRSPVRVSKICKIGWSERKHESSSALLSNPHLLTSHISEKCSKKLKYFTFSLLYSFCTVLLTFVMLLHQWQVDLLQAMEIVHTCRVLGNTGNITQSQECFTGEIVGRNNVMIHDSEAYHCALVRALLQRNSELVAFLPVGIQCFLNSYKWTNGVIPYSRHWQQ